jgi:hypothetical protein
VFRFCVYPAPSFVRINTVATAESGLDALLTPEESVILLVDHQAFQFAKTSVRVAAHVGHKSCAGSSHSDSSMCRYSE